MQNQELLLVFMGKKCCSSVCCFQKNRLTLLLLLWLEFVSTFLGKVSENGVQGIQRVQGDQKQTAKPQTQF